MDTRYIRRMADLLLGLSWVAQHCTTLHNFQKPMKFNIKYKLNGLS
jgi:hypothetical protein